MKKLSFFLMAMLFSVMSFAQTVLFTQTYPGSPSTYTNAYTKSFTVTTGDYTLTYTNINNGQASNAWTEIRSGSKNGASVATIASKQIAAPIDKVVINFTQANASSTNALYLEVSANSDFSSVTKIEADIAVGNVEFPIAAPAANQYYKITIDQAKGSANGFNRFNKVVFYQGEAAGEDVEIVAAPEFSVTEANFTTAFTLDITSEEGTTLKYTIDNTDPSTSATAIEVATNSTSVQITKSTAVKAIAIKGELKSVTKSKVYCYVNSAETAYTVAEAMEVIDAGLGLANELYVKGEISTIEKYDANYGSITYWIKDEEGNKFECYSGLGLNKAKFTKKEDLVVGSKVVVCGVMKKYNTTYEFNYNNYIVSLELPVVKFNVTVTAENGTVEGAGEYEENAEATLTATAAEGYEFVNWTVADSIVSTENPYTFNVTADVALVANFKAVVVEEPLPEGVPTNAELWEAFKPYYNTYYGLTRADQPIDKVSTFAAAKMQEIMTDAASEYKWLGDYVLGVAAGQGVNLPTDMAAANEGAWRWAVHAFFNATTGANGAAGTDFTEAGKPQVWGPYYLAAQKPAEGPVEIVGIVKRALQLNDTTIILTHEANGTPHIYTVAGKTIAEVSQEGVVAKDTANAGDYLTISDIALTEDGKLVACNYVRNQFEDKNVDAGYKRGTLHLYVWHDIKGAASIWFESMFTGNSVRGDCGYTMAVNGTVANANILVTAVHNSHRGVRMSHYTVIDSAYVEPNYANQTFNNHLFYVGAKFKGASAGVDAATFNEATHGVNFQLNASPLAENNWVMDSEGLMPTEFGVAAKEDPSIVGAVAETLVSKALVGAYYVTIGEKKVMVAPYADAEGKLAGVKLLDITAGFANATLLTTAESLDLTAPVAATGVATTAVVESNGTLTINLIADATIYTMTATIQESPSTNLENNNVQNDIIKFYQNGQIYIMINGAVYNVMGQMVK